MEEKKVLIEVKNLSKKYLLDNKEFYALQDISFTLRQGDSIGLIGKNGSGKSTLLKILSGLVKPSSGQVTINGKVNSLLEIGSNFIPDLTGRENVEQFLALNNVPKHLIKDKIEEIYEFSGLNQFFDQSIKYYSSGMFIRLAISSGFQIDADIFLIDEVLMAGDLAFREKVSIKFNEIVNNGAGIIIASHNIEEILDNSNLVLWFKEGVQIEMGDSETVIENYYDFLNKINLKIKRFETIKIGDLEEYCNNISELDKKYLENKHLKVEKFSIHSNAKIYSEEGFLIQFEYFKKNEKMIFYPIFKIYDSKMNFVGVLPSIDDSKLKDKNELLKEHKGLVSFNCSFPKNILNEGIYYLELAVGSVPDEETGYSNELYKLKVKLKFEVFFKSRNLSVTHYDTTIRPKCYWEINRIK